MTRRPVPLAAADAGVSVVELAIASALSMVVVAIALSGLLVMSRTDVRAGRYAAALDELRTAVERLERELRHADRVAGVSANRIDLEIDYDGDGTIDPGEAVTWRLQSADGGLSRLVRTTETGTVVAAQGVAKADGKAFVFVAPKLVRIRLEAQTPDGGDGDAWQVATDVILRNAS